MRGILTATHRGADDFTLVVPAELLAQQKQTQRIFGMVMVALASISLLVGGNPFATSSIYTLIHALERTWGVSFPRGGTAPGVER